MTSFRMTKLIFLVALVAAAGAGIARADAPATFAGGVYREKVLGTVAVGRPVLEARNLYVLRTDGTFSIFYQGLVGPRSGRWSYERRSATSATLVLGDVTRNLVFEDQTSGSWGTGNALQSTFTLDPVVAVSAVANTSNLVSVSAGGSIACGFVVRTETVALVRAIGPGLQPFGVGSPLRQPRLKLMRVGAAGSQSDVDLIATTDAHPVEQQPSGDDVVRLFGAHAGAFVMHADDAAAVAVLKPGAYVAQVDSSNPGDTGQVLIETYHVGF